MLRLRLRLGDFVLRSDGEIDLVQRAIAVVDWLDDKLRAASRVFEFAGVLEIQLACGLGPLGEALAVNTLRLWISGAPQHEVRPDIAGVAEGWIKDLERGLEHLVAGLRDGLRLLDAFEPVEVL